MENKDANVNEYLLWDGNLAKVVDELHGKAVIIEMVEDKEKCPHCRKITGKKRFHMLVGSNAFQENAEPVKTIKS